MKLSNRPCGVSFAALLLALLVGGSEALYSASGPVTILDPSSFESQLEKGPDALWMVEFYAPWCGHCKALQPEWEKAARALKGVVKVAAVDVDAHDSLGAKFNVRGFPTIKLLRVENKKVKATDYDGQRTAADIAKFAMKHASKVVFDRLGVKQDSSAGGGGSSRGRQDEFYGGTDVASLDVHTFEEEVADSDDLWLVEFYAPWCGHCRNLKPEWIQAASTLRGKVKLGAVNCDEEDELCGRFGVQGFPTIKYFGPNKDRPQDYDGGREADDIVSFAMSKWEQFAPAAEVLELVDQEVFVNQCTGHQGDNSLDLEPVDSKSLCIVAFLPHILDSQADGRNAYIDTLKAGAENFKGRAFSFLWAEGGKQPQLEANLEVGGFGYPAVVALYPKQGKFATLKGSLEEAHLKSWMERLQFGREKVAAVRGDLAEVATTDAWDGLDGDYDLEEEFDLSELEDE